MSVDNNMFFIHSDLLFGICSVICECLRNLQGGAVCLPWIADEKVALYVCYQRTGGAKKGGYIKRNCMTVWVLLLEVLLALQHN